MIELCHICKTYYSKKAGCFEAKALSDISISFPDKGMLFVVGKSGSGKSTLLNVIGGIEKPDSGYLLVDGKDSRTFNNKDWDEYRADRIGFVFQEYNLIDELSAGQNIALAGKLRIGKAEAEERARKALKDVGLEGFYSRRPAELSGGERQRVALARALVKDSQIILADEPTGALDSETGKQIFDLLREIANSRLVVVVTHDLDFARDFGDRVVTIKDGSLVADALGSSLSTEKTGGPRLEANHIGKRKHRLGFSSSLRLSLVYLRSRPFRLFSAILLSVCAFGFFGLSDTLASFNEESVAANSLKANGTTLLSLQGANFLHSQLTPQDIDDIKEKTNVSFQGINRDKTIYFSQSIPVGSTSKLNRLSSIYRNTAEGFVGIKDGNLPVTCSLKAGSLPSQENQVALTMYQYALFASVGYQNPVLKTSKPITATEMSMDKLIGMPLTYSSQRTGDGSEGICYISGFVDAGFNEGKYDYLRSYLLNFSSPLDARADTLEKSLESYLSVSLDNAIFVSDNWINAIENGPIICSAKNDVSIFQAPGNSMVFQTHSFLNYVNLDTNAFFFSPESTALLDSQFMVPFEDYCDEAALVSNSIEKKSFVLYGDYCLDGQDKAVDEIPYVFFRSLPNYAIRYISGKNYSQAFADQEFDIEAYANQYYLSIGKPNPGLSSLPEEDKPQIFALFITDAWRSNYLCRNSSAAQKYFLLSFALAKEMVQRYVKENASEYFGVRSFSYIRSGDPSKTFSLDLAGFTIGSRDYHCILLSRKTLSSLGEDADSFYSRAFAQIPNDDALLFNVVHLNFTREEGWANRFYVANPELSSILEIASKVSLFQTVFLVASAVLAVFSSFLLFSYLSASISDKRSEIGILRSLGTRKSDVFLIFYLESIFIAVVSSLLSYVIVFPVAALINDSLAGSFGVVVTLLMAGPRQVFLVLALSIVVATLSTVFPIVRISNEPPVHSIRGL